MSRFAQEVAREGGLAHFAIAMPLHRGSGPITVLLVDDDDQVRGFCRSLLTANGFTVLEASNGHFLSTGTDLVGITTHSNYRDNPAAGR